MSESRKLVAILAADVVGFSRLAGADEDRTLARLRTLRSDLIDPTVAVHHGRVVKRTGDGLLVEFRSVVDAVRCAIEIQSGMVERNAGLPAERRIEFRAGIHLGDVVEESDGDLMGDGVNIAARLEGIAKPGTICLSEDAYRQVRARLDLAVSDLGQTQLKNITELVRVYSLEVGVPAGREQSSPPLILGSVLVAIIILIGGGVLYMRPFARTSPAAPPLASQTVVQSPPPVSAPPQQLATQTPAPRPPPQTATPAPPPEPSPASQPSPDETAWQNATAAATRESFGEYLKQFSAGVHVQEAQLT
jgi:class 3 adenylate cyclase